MQSLPVFDFGVNTDSFFGIGFGLLQNPNIDLFKKKAESFFKTLETFNINFNNIEINTEAEQLYPGFLERVIFPVFRSYGVTSASVHAPYLQLNPSSPLEDYRNFSASSLVNLIGVCGGLDIKRFVIHLTSEFEDMIPFMPVSDEARAKLVDLAVVQAQKSLEQIIQSAGVEPARLAVENLEVFPFERLYPVIRENGVSICFDMGHWGLNGFKPEEFVDKFGPISEIHIQDMSERREDLRTTARKEHLPLGAGILRPKDFFNYLGEKLINYPANPVSLIIENRSSSDMLRSLEFLKSNGFLEKINENNT